MSCYVTARNIMRTSKAITSLVPHHLIDSTQTASSTTMYAKQYKLEQNKCRPNFFFGGDRSDESSTSSLDSLKISPPSFKVSPPPKIINVLEEFAPQKRTYATSATSSGSSGTTSGGSSYGGANGNGSQNVGIHLETSLAVAVPVASSLRPEDSARSRSAARAPGRLDQRYSTHFERRIW